MSDRLHTLDRLWSTIEDRRGADPDESWTARLLSKGPEKCAEKFGEEAIEALIEAVKGDTDALTREGADVHLKFQKNRTSALNSASFRRTARILKKLQDDAPDAEPLRRLACCPDDQPANRSTAQHQGD